MNEFTKKFLDLLKTSKEFNNYVQTEWKCAYNDAKSGSNNYEFFYEIILKDFQSKSQYCLCHKDFNMALSYISGKPVLLPTDSSCIDGIALTVDDSFNIYYYYCKNGSLQYYSRWSRSYSLLIRVKRMLSSLRDIERDGLISYMPTSILSEINSIRFEILSHCFAVNMLASSDNGLSFISSCFLDGVIYYFLDYTISVVLNSDALLSEFLKSGYANAHLKFLLQMLKETLLDGNSEDVVVGEERDYNKLKGMIASNKFDLDK